MSNELLWFLWVIINFSFILISYKLFGKVGLFVWIGVGTILANIQVTKTIELFGLTSTLGNIMYGTIFLATDALSEVFNKKTAGKAVIIGFFTLFTTMIIMQISLLFTPESFDTGHAALSTIFGLVPRIATASLIAYAISQFLDVNLFDKIKKRFPGDRTLWLRNNLSTFISQFVDTIIFVPIAFLGLFEFNVVVDIFITTYFIKLIIAILDTPFLYLIKKTTPLQHD